MKVEHYNTECKPNQQAHPYTQLLFDEPGSSHVGFVVNKVTLEQVFSEYFGFPCQSSYHQFLHNHHHPGLVQQASSGRSTHSHTARI
jgi:hypothetical protein